MEQLPGSLIVIANYDELQQAHDQANSFLPEANFWYLSGISEPGWRIIIDSKHHKSYAVYPKLSETKQLFDGGVDVEFARSQSGIENVIDSDEADSLLRQLRRQHRLVYTAMEESYIKKYAEFSLNPAQKELKKYLAHRFEGVRDCREYISNLRAVKQSEEVAAIKQAAKISASGFLSVQKQLQSYTHEYQIEATLSHEFRTSGSMGHAYQPIVAAGLNACTLHYIANNDRFSKRTPVLIDAATRYDNYAADISRTLIANSPSKRQQAIYDGVKHVFDECIKQLRPGLMLNELQKTAHDKTATVLKGLGLEHDDDSVRDYFPHAIGHSLGIDTHDTFGSHTELKEGMVLTVEPGLYIPKEKIGIRYEDDFVITTGGYQNLSGKYVGDVWYTSTK